MFGCTLYNPIMQSSGFDADAKLIFSAMSSYPTETKMLLIDNAVRSLKSSSIWDKLYSLQVYAAADQQAALVDWKVPSRVATTVNSPTFTVDRGFAGDGLTSYVDCGYTTASYWTENPTSNFMCVRVNADLTTPAAAMVEFGDDRSYISAYNNTNQTVTQNASTSSDNTSGGTSLRYVASSRYDGSNYNVYYGKSGTLSAVGKARTGSGGRTMNITVLARNYGPGSANSFSTRQVSLSALGSYLTQAEANTFATIMDAYMTGVGNVG